MAIETVEDQLLADMFDWMEDVLPLSVDRLVPDSRGGENQSVPVPDEPFIMLRFDPMNVVLGEQAEHSNVDVGSNTVEVTRTRRMKATANVQAFGNEGIKHLTTLQLSTSEADFPVMPIGSISDLSELNGATDTEGRYALDLEVRYKVSRVVRTVPGLKTLELSVDFTPNHTGDDIEDDFIVTL
jgi:hypothetical protein